MATDFKKCILSIATQEELIELLLTEKNAVAFDTPITYLGLNNVTQIKGFEGGKKSPYSFALNKDSELREMIDYHLMQVKNVSFSKNVTLLAGMCIKYFFRKFGP